MEATATAAHTSSNLRAAIDTFNLPADAPARFELILINGRQSLNRADRRDREGYTLKAANLRAAVAADLTRLRAEVAEWTRITR